ncbi:restriction endonuclease subunit S [Hwangdonia lutea]|uniref:Restriction endonuclease subunit S n=1 Tax=Hwangdonia lutea TaxID=3075823 RepID=A0AA97EL13_9FLAO|nr:restriction endonuclease subunit S [Hwangdonia sp. SCSIO 19198]WOD42379.1 restriction endonuclease subunit S [Hwangdonia sp. SCSIO 19198]
MNKEEQVLPELRFPEFNKEGKWEITTIGQMGSFYYGKSAPKWSLSEDAPTLCVRYGELYTKFGTIIKEVYSRTNIDPKTLRFSKGGEILVPRVGEDPFAFSNCSYLPFPNIAIGEMISVYETEQDSIFYAYYFNTLSSQFAKVVEGQNVKNLYYVNLEPIKIGKPKSIEEQQKIAKCLSSLDEVINAETEKLKLLQDHKKGLLQQLFPQEGETQPKYRFPEYRNDGDWKETTLDAVADYKNGKAHEKEISKTGKYKVVNSKFISTEGEVVKFSDSVNLETKIGDILMVLSDIPNGKALSKCFYVDKNDTYTVNQRICKITSTNINSVFLFYQLNRNKYFLRFDDGNKQTNLRKDDVLNCPILKPTNPKEQDKIANTLTSASTLIEEQQEKIRRLQAHKKGLLQQLFPNLNDVAV